MQSQLNCFGDINLAFGRILKNPGVSCYRTETLLQADITGNVSVYKSSREEGARAVIHFLS